MGVRGVDVECVLAVVAGFEFMEGIEIMQKVFRVLSHMRKGVIGVFDSKKIAERIQRQNPGSIIELGLSSGCDKPLSCGQWLEGLLGLTPAEVIDVMTNHVEEIDSAIAHEAVALSKFADLVNACSDDLAGDPALIAARVALGYDEPEEFEEDDEADSLRAALFNE